MDAAITDLAKQLKDFKAKMLESEQELSINLEYKADVI